MSISLNYITPLLSVLLLFALNGCGSQRAETSHVDTDACDLLSNADIQAVQGETVSAAKGDRRTNGQFTSTQCFYTLPTYSKSISIDVMHPDNARASAEFWDKRFHNADSDADEEEAAERPATSANSTPDREAEEEKAKARPQPVSGIGDEAFWTGTQVNGSLYVRHGIDIVRISIGGADAQPAKIEKARTLAEKAIARLK